MHNKIKSLCRLLLPKKREKLFGSYSSAGLLAGALVGFWLAALIYLVPIFGLSLSRRSSYLIIFLLPFPLFLIIMLPYILVNASRFRWRRLVLGLFLVFFSLLAYFTVFGMIFEPLISLDALSPELLYKFLPLFIFYYLVFLLLIFIFFRRRAAAPAIIALPLMLWLIFMYVFFGATMSGVGSRIYGAVYAAAAIAIGSPLFGLMLWGTLDR